MTSTAQHPNEEVAIIEQALLVLAGRCDGAIKHDEMGFNAFDAPFGHDLATQIASGRSLSVGQATKALSMIRKYRVQLADAGITLPENYSPVSAGSGEKIKAWIANYGAMLVSFPAPLSKEHIEVKNFIKGLPGTRWLPNAEGAPWSVPQGQISKVEALLSKRSDVEFLKTQQPSLEQPTPTPIAPVAPASKAEIEIKVEDGMIRFYFSYGTPNFNSLKDRVKSLESRRWMPDLPGKPWQAPMSVAREVVNLFPEATLPEELAKLANELDLRAELGRKASGEFDVPGLGGELMPFQRAGVQALDVAKGNMILGDEMGLGKTIQELAFLQLHPELRPAVIVVPASVKINWLREASRWLRTDDRFVIANGRKPNGDLDNATILIINYDILSYWKKAIIAWEPKHIAFDEAHYLKNFRPNRKNKSANSQRANVAFDLAAKIGSVIPITGTPVMNRPIEMFPMLHLVDPNTWASYWAFAKRYCGADPQNGIYDVNGATNLKELHEKIKPYFIRRTKSQVLSELPDKRRATLVISFDETQRKEYLQYIEEATRSVTQAEALVTIEKAKQAAVRGKIAGIIDWIGSMLDSGEKLVVFTTHNWTVDQIVSAFPLQSVTITGGTPLDQRQEAVDRFQNDDSIRLAVCNIIAGGVGITLTAASNVAFIEFAWRPSDHSQAEDRLHRIGQKNAVVAWYLVAENTIDEEIVRLLESKREIVETVHDGMAGNLSFETDGVKIEGDSSILAQLMQILREQIASQEK